MKSTDGNRVHICIILGNCLTPNAVGEITAVEGVAVSNNLFKPRQGLRFYDQIVITLHIIIYFPSPEALSCLYSHRQDLPESLRKLRAVIRPSLLFYQLAVGSTSVSVSSTCFPQDNTCISEVFKHTTCTSKIIRIQHHEKDSNTLTYS